MLQQACGDRASSDRDRLQAGRDRSREPNGAAPLHAVAVVALGNSGDVVINQQDPTRDTGLAIGLSEALPASQNAARSKNGDPATTK